MCKINIGFAIEHACSQYFDVSAQQYTNFIEYGIHLDRGMPKWVFELRERLKAQLNLHPLDINLAANTPPDDSWCETLAETIQNLGVTAVVSDAWFWHHGKRGAMWPRPSLMPASSTNCRENAAHIAKKCGLPFRIENPPVEWMPVDGSIWRFLEEASDHDAVEICLDISHLIQFEQNVHGKEPELPTSFPWHKVKEIHLAGYVSIEYQGQICFIDEHLSEIPDKQYKLLSKVLELRGSCDSLDVCLEMEPRSSTSYQMAAERLQLLFQNRIPNFN